MTCHPAPGNQSAAGVELPLAGNLSIQRVLETRRPLMVLDAQHDPLRSNVQHMMERPQVQSILPVPLLVRDEVIGAIGFDVLHAPHTFSEEEIDLAQTVANLVAVRIEQARLFEAERVARQQAQRHAQDLTGLYAITRATIREMRQVKTGAEPTAGGEYEIDGRPVHWQSLPVRVGLRPMGRLIVMRDMTEERTQSQCHPRYMRAPRALVTESDSRQGSALKSQIPSTKSQANSKRE